MENDVRHKTKSITAPNPVWDNKMKWIYDSDDTLAMLRCKVSKELTYKKYNSLTSQCY